MYEDINPEGFTYVLPEEQAHWAQVRSFLATVEADNPPDLEAIVQAVKERFPTFASVQADANRILDQLA